MKYLLVAVVLGLVSLLDNSNGLSTFPVSQDGQTPVVAAVEGSTNVMVFCEVTLNGDPTFTNWFLTRLGGGRVLLTFNINGTGTSADSQNFRVIGNLFSNITILTFNNLLDMALLECAEGNTVMANFTLRIIKPPVLRQVSVPQSVIENTSFSFNIENTTGYPLLPQFTWFYNEVVISSDSTNPNISVYPYITFSSVSRSQSGNYSMIASNEGGNSTGYFILDVQYGPEGIVQSGPVYVITNNDVIITSYTNVSGNPIPSSSWSKDGGLSISSGGRFNTDILGQLMITSVLLSDVGHYNNTLENTVVNTNLSISNIIELVVVDPPSQPRDVIGDPGSTTVNLTWRNPAVLGTSPLSLFTVMIDPLTNGLSAIMINYTATNSTDPTFLNSVMITGLYPNTQYTVRVRAYSTHNVVGTLTSNSSTVVIFNTTSTVPELQSVILTNVNGNLTVKWTFIHTGGVLLDNISISCRSEELEDNVDFSGDYELTNTLLCTSMADCIGKNISVGPVTAGTNYSCIVTVTNSIGNDMMRSNNINVMTGIPSKPIISSVSGDSPGQAILYIYTMYSGITDISTFQYIIIVLGINRTMISVTPQLSEFNGVSINATIEVELSPGRYQFIVISSNIYGNSEQSENSSIIMVVPTTQTTPTTSIITTSTVGPSVTPTTTVVPSMSIIVSATPTTSPPTETSPSGLSGGAIAGIVIAIIILIAIAVLVGLIILYILYKNKGDSYQVERGGGGKGKGVTVEELDIDIGTELKGTSSGGGGSQTDQPSTEKPELHYADLEHFQRKPQQGGQHVSASKPQPIQEVHYAEIKPQDATQTSTT